MVPSTQSGRRAAALLMGSTLAAVFAGFASGEPEAIERTELERRCPDNFTLSGKMCTSLVYAAPIVGCAPGFSYVDERCISYRGMAERCGDGLERVTDVGCVREDQTSPVLGCSPGYSLTERDTCVKTVQLSEVRLCPPASKVKGDRCVREVMGEPELVCTPGATLVGKRCVSETLYDCTPERNGTDLAHAVDQFGADSLRARARQIRRAQLGKDDGVTEESYIVSATCKRVVNEPAAKRCPENTAIMGKQCLLETVVDFLVTDGGQETVEGELNYQCPLDYAIVTDPLTREVICSRTLVRPAALHCAIGVEEDGRCRVEMKPIVTCADSYKFNAELNQCEKTVHAEPIVQYTVSYACTGKDCERQAAGLQPRPL